MKKRLAIYLRHSVSFNETLTRIKDQNVISNNGPHSRTVVNSTWIHEMTMHSFIINVHYVSLTQTELWHFLFPRSLLLSFPHLCLLILFKVSHLSLNSLPQPGLEASTVLLPHTPYCWHYSCEPLRSSFVDKVWMTKEAIMNHMYDYRFFKEAARQTCFIRTLHLYGWHFWKWCPCDVAGFFFLRGGGFNPKIRKTKQSTH